MVNKDLFVLENFESKLMTRYHIIPSLWVRGGETPPEPAGWVETRGSAQRPRPSGRGQEEWQAHTRWKSEALRRTIWVWWGRRRVIQWLQSRHLVIWVTTGLPALIALRPLSQWILNKQPRWAEKTEAWGCQLAAQGHEVRAEDPPEGGLLTFPSELPEAWSAPDMEGEGWVKLVPFQLGDSEQGRRAQWGSCWFQIKTWVFLHTVRNFETYLI